MTVYNRGWLQKVTNDRLFSLNLTFLNCSQYPHIFYIIYVFLLNKLTFLPYFIYRHIYRKWVLLVDSKCRNTVILVNAGLTYTSSRKGFHDGCAKRGFFPHQKLKKNRLSLAHCALNRSFTVSVPHCLIFSNNLCPCDDYFCMRKVSTTYDFLFPFLKL